jgi:hypothetical protein
MLSNLNQNKGEYMNIVDEMVQQQHERIDAYLETNNDVMDKLSDIQKLVQQHRDCGISFRGTIRDNDQIREILNDLSDIENKLKGMGDKHG